MPVRSVTVTAKSRSAGRLPEWATKYVVLVESLQVHGVLQEISARLQVARRDGYSGLDIVLFLLLYFASSCRCGLRSFSDRCRPHARELAAVAGRQSWPTQASVSRFLSDLDAEQVGVFGDWLLGAGCHARVLEQSTAIVHRDACGHAWHVFDYDPTVETLRQRALPQSDEEPVPQRRSATLAAPGYPGRKRGEVQISRATLQHAGAGLWLSIRVGPGNGEHRRHYQAAIAAVVTWCARTDHSLRSAVLRTDGGAGGSVPAITLCREAGLPYLTRLARYEVLAWPEVAAALAGAAWGVVADAGSGPQREAAELGTLRLAAGQESVREDGRPYAPLETRVVVSRFPASERKRGAGLVQDGWHYELYATDLPAPAWPADEVVTGYYGRCGQENRFHQEDDELELGRIFNYTPAGQELANLIGLLVWNQGICRGLELSSPLPKDLPPQPPRAATTTPPAGVVTPRPDDDQPHASVAPAPAASLPVESGLPEAVPTATAAHLADDGRRRPPPSETAGRTPTSPSQNVVPAGDPTTPTTEATASSTTVIAPPPGRPTAAAAVAAATTPAALKALCVTALLAVDWTPRLAALPGWRYDVASGLRCPRDQELRLHRAAVAGHSVTMNFRTRPSACPACPTRSSCTVSSSPTFCKELALTMPLGIFESAPAGTRAPAVRVPTTRRVQPCEAPPPRWRPTPGATHTGPLQSAPPALLPSVLRHRLTAACTPVEVHVSVTMPRLSRPRRVDYFAYSRRERQHRRLTWNSRFHRNQLPDTVALDLRLVGGHRLKPLLRVTN